jgi:hypothetical protein
MCGAAVRVVETESSDLIVIDDTPHPDGNLIPWPAQTPQSLARARRLTVPLSSGPMWREHECPYTRHRDT